MELLSVPRIALTGLGPDYDRTAVTVGLILALRKLGLSASCAVSGSNLNEALILRRLCGRSVLTMDEALLNPGQILISTYMAGVGADILVLAETAEAVGSIRSGISIAALTHTPLCCVIDGAQGFAAARDAWEELRVVLGDQDMAGWISFPGPAPESDIYKELQHAIPHAGINFLGALPAPSNQFTMPPRSIDQQRNLSLIAREYLLEMGSAFAQSINCDAILQAARASAYMRLENFEYHPKMRRSRIAISDDSAFNICFQDNVEYLRYFGAEMIPFSPLADTALPPRIGAMYLTGAYLEEYGQELAKNTPMMQAIRDFVERGGVVYAEGSSVAYLCEQFPSLESGGFHEGVGIIKASAIYQAPILPVIQALTFMEDTILGAEGSEVRGISVGGWSVDRPDRFYRCARVRAEDGSASTMDGFSPTAQSFLYNGFLHFGTNPEIARYLVDAAEVVASIGG
jgi:cobyrinic acid a,c-diamide synthase